MHEEQRQRAHDHLRAAGIERALFAARDSVTWLTGFAPPLQLGQHPFAGGPPLLWYAGGEWTLLVVDGYADAAAASGIPVESYRGYTIDEPIAGGEHLRAALQQVVGRTTDTRCGVEERAVAAAYRDVVGGETVAIDGQLVPLRVRKTDEELTKLRANFALTDIGHAAARTAVLPGRNELDVWAATHAAIQKAAGQRVPLGNDCTVGRRAHNGGWPLDIEIQAHDSFVVDLSTLLHGYWSDSCATYYAGELTPRQRAMHATVTDALAFATSLVRPGAIAHEIDSAVRDYMRKAGYPVYGHHTGHGVGVTGHEEPRLVPYNDMRIEPGMVIMVEPGIYYPDDTAIRLEDALLVTDNGVEVLTKHDKSA